MMIGERAKLMVVDNQPERLASISGILRSAEYEVLEIGTASNCFDSLPQFWPSIVFFSDSLPEELRLDFLRKIREYPFSLPTFLIFGSSSGIDGNGSGRGAPPMSRPKENLFWPADNNDPNLPCDDPEFLRPRFLPWPMKDHVFLGHVETLLQIHRLEANWQETNQHLEQQLQLRTVELLRVNRILHREIEEHKRIAEKLRASKTRLRHIFNHMSNGVVVYEAIDGGENFIIKEFNPACERITQHREAEVLGCRVTEVFPKVKEIGLLNVFQSVWRTGISKHHPTSLYQDESLAIWVENYVFKLPAGEIVSIFNDVTREKSAEASLRKSEVWHRSLIELGVSMYIVMDAQKRILYASPQCRKILDVPPEDILGKSIFEYVQATDVESFARFFADVSLKPGRVLHAVTRFRSQDNQIKIIEAFGINLLDEPNIQGIIFSGHDITEQVHNRERIDELRNELAHSSRLAAMGELASGIAHEINQPLSVVNTWAEVAMREISEKLSGDKEESLLALKRIDTAIERSGKIVHRMKDFARKSEPRMVNLSLIDAIDEMLPFVEHQLKIADIALTVDIPREYSRVFADRMQIQQVFLNLILNAVNSLENTKHDDRRIHIRSVFRAGVLEISVCDSGCGIPLDQLEKVFSPFYSTKPEGMGLGLPICQTILQQHGGRIWASRNSDRGTTITFTLPLIEEQRHAREYSNLHCG